MADAIGMSCQKAVPALQIPYCNHLFKIKTEMVIQFPFSNVN